MGSEWADSGTGGEWDGNNSSSYGGTGNAGTEISNGRGRETSVGKRNIATVPVPVPFPYRPDHFSSPDFYRAKPCNFYAPLFSHAHFWYVVDMYVYVMQKL